MKVIFLIPYPKEDAASRYRVYQYVKDLKQNNISPVIIPFFSCYLYKIKNDVGCIKFFIKVILLLLSIEKRLLTLFALPLYDAVFIHREIFPFFTPFFEKIAKKLNKNIIFDFDDAIYTKPTYYRNWRDYLRNPKKVSEICKLASYVIVGNKSLYRYAKEFNNSVIILPTVYNIRNNRNNRREKGLNKKLVIGWIGSWSTVKSLNVIKSALGKLASQYRFQLKIIGARNIFEIKIRNVDIKYKLWRMEDEINEIKSFDIGIMPLLDTEWERGKCGFKLIQYMTLGIPVVASPVGVNKEVISDGDNGFLATTDEEWFTKLSCLIENPDLRKDLGERGKKTIREKYSFEENACKLLDIFRNLNTKS